MEVVGGKAAHLHKRDGQSVTERHLDRGGGRRRQFIGAGFPHGGQEHADVRCRRNGALRTGSEAEQRNAEALAILDDRAEFAGLARMREHEDDVVRRHHAKVAMACVGRVHEERGRSGRGQGRGHLARDDAALAHAGDDQAAPHAHDHADDAQEYCGEVPVGEFRFQRIQAMGCDRQCPAGRFHDPAARTKRHNFRYCRHKFALFSMTISQVFLISSAWQQPRYQRTAFHFVSDPSGCKPARRSR